MKALRVILSLVVVLAICGAIWYRMEHRASDEDSSSDDVAATANVATLPLRRVPITQRLDTYGVVSASPSGQQSVSIAYDCRVVALPVRSGEHVAKGEFILGVAPTPDASLLFESAIGDLVTAQKTLKSVETRFELHLVARADLLAAQQVARDAERKVQNYRARGLGGDGRLRASAAGIITHLEVTKDSLVPAGTPLCFISEDSDREVRFGVEANQFAAVHPGQPVTLRSLASPDSPTVLGSVTAVASAVDPVSGKVEVRVTIPSSAPFAMGERVGASVALLTHTSFVVPRSAVLPGASGSEVYLDRNGKAVRCSVTPGIVSGDQVEISSPHLQDGDLVVVQGNAELSDGMSVKVISADKEVAP